ncbi:hypothetical protein [Vreelandella titanicae]|nr:hypothetical protein [Halomonas titanicae]
MTVSYEQSQKAWQLSQRGFSVSEVAERLDTSYECVFQLMAFYQLNRSLG